MYLERSLTIFQMGKIETFIANEFSHTNLSQQCKYFDDYIFRTLCPSSGLKNLLKELRANEF